MTDARHHLHKRKRIHERHESYPHEKSWKRILDRTVLFFGVAGPLLTFPQVWEIWKTQSAENINPVTWSTYLLASIVWTVYGIAHKEVPIIISQALYIVATGLVLVGIAIF